MIYVWSSGDIGIMREHPNVDTSHGRERVRGRTKENAMIETITITVMSDTDGNQTFVYPRVSVNGADGRPFGGPDDALSHVKCELNAAIKRVRAAIKRVRKQRPAVLDAPPMPGGYFPTPTLMWRGGELVQQWTSSLIGYPDVWVRVQGDPAEEAVRENLRKAREAQPRERT